MTSKSVKNYNDNKYHELDCKFHMNKSSSVSNINIIHGNRSHNVRQNVTWKIDNDDYVDSFVLLNQDVCDDVIPSHLDGIGAKELKYDLSSNMPNPKEKHIIKRDEIEFTEITFYISSLASSIMVNCDERQLETIRGKNEVYAENCARAKSDGATQTDSEPTAHEGCQGETIRATVAGAQCHAFDITDAFDGAAAVPPPVDDGRAFRERAVHVERTLARNAMDCGHPAAADAGRASGDRDDPRPPLEYRFAMDVTATGTSASPVTCVQWNHADVHMVAVGYGEPANAVAVWTVKNPLAPERLYKFGENTITSLSFSVAMPRYLAVGFEYEDLLIIDITSYNLEVVSRLSNQLTHRPVNVVDMFWTFGIDDKLYSEPNQSELFLKCGSNGQVVCYRLSNNTVTEKTIMELFDSEMFTQTKHDSELSRKKCLCSATKIVGLNQNTYVIGTVDGWVYSCQYKYPMNYLTKSKAHMGMIKSLEKSPYSWDVFLTTGNDFSIKIWVGDFFSKPVITLTTNRRIEKAIWSRTNSTIIVSINDDSIHVWDISAPVPEPTLVCCDPPRAHHKLTDIGFSSDGKHLCATDTGGRVFVYAWSGVARATLGGDLVDVITKSLRDQPRLLRALCLEQPAYAVGTKLASDSTELSSRQ